MVMQDNLLNLGVTCQVFRKEVSPYLGALPSSASLENHEFLPACTSLVERGGQ